MKRQCKWIRFCAMALALVLLLNPVTIGSATEISPLANSYVSSFDVSSSAIGAGRVTISFDVYGTNSWDLGVKTIEVYESVNNVDWYWVRTYSSSTFTNMIGHNVMEHHSSVTYYGIAGRYYKAYVCVWGGDEDAGVGDSEYVWTGVVKG